MDLQSDYSVDDQNVMLVPSVDPPIYNAFNGACRSFNAPLRSLTTVNDSLIHDTSPILSDRPCIDDGSIIRNDWTSSGLSLTTQENHFTTEEVVHWQMEDLPLFPELHLLPDIATVGENDPQIPTTDELRVASPILEKAQLPYCVGETKQTSGNGNDPRMPTTDELRVASPILEKAQLPYCVGKTKQTSGNGNDSRMPTTDGLRITPSIFKKPQLPYCVGETTQISGDGNDPQIPTTDGLRITRSIFKKPQLPYCVGETTQISGDGNDPQIPTTDGLRITRSILKKLQLLYCAEETTQISGDGNDLQIPTTDKIQQKQNKRPTVKILTKTRMPHRYNTRMTAYKKKLSDFIVQEQEMLDRVRKNQQRPTARVGSSPHDQWIHSKDWVHINLLKAHIPIKKLPNYSETTQDT